MYVSLELITESQIVPEMHYMYTPYSLSLFDTKNHQKAGKKQEAGGEESETTFPDKTKSKIVV